MKLSYHKLVVLVSSIFTCATVGAAAPSSPPLDGLALWLKGDQGVTTNATGGVTLWADQSGNLNDAAQINDAQAPTLKLDHVNGQPAVYFDGIDDFLDVTTSPTIENMGDIASFAVVRFDDFGSYRSIWGKTLANTPASTDWYFVPNTGLPTVYRGDSGADITSVQGTKGPKGDTYAVVGFQMSGTMLTHYLNGTPTGSGEIFSFLYDAQTNLKIGSRDDFGTRMRGDIAELLIYNVALSDEDVATVTEYLRNKYGIVNVPPTVSVTSPTENSTVGVGTNIDVTISANDEDGRVVKVDFLANGSRIGTAIAPPYKFTVQFKTPGSMVLTAIATDDKDGAATSGPVNVTITSSEPAPELASSSHLKLWLKGDEGMTTDDFGSITTWADQSGNGNDAITDPLFAPVLADMDGHPAGYFNGVDSELDIFDSDSLSITGDIAAFVVARFEDFGGYRGILGKTVGNQPRPFDFYLLPNSGAPRVFRGYATNDIDGLEVNVSGFVQGQAPQVGTPSMLGFQQSGEIMTQYLNGRPSGSGTIALTAQDGDTMLKVGSRDDYATLMKGEIAEVLLYDAALAPAELDNVRDYLGYKYNLAVLLTTNIAPTVALTNLTEGQSFTTPTNITLEASASDADGGIAKVQFFANGTPLPADSSAPFSAALPLQVAGQIELVAVATDNLGLLSTSSIVHITATGSEPLPIPASGLVLWLRSDKGVTETNGVVTGWQDFSGSFNDASQSNEAKAPALAANVLNGKPVLRFDGLDDSLDVAGSSSLALTADMTTFFVVNIADFVTYRVVWAKTAGNLARPYDYYTLPSTGIPRAFRGGAAGHSTVDALTAPIPGEFSLMGWEVSSTNLTHYLNGTENGSGAVTAEANDQGNPLRIGTRGDDFTRLKGDLAEIIIYNRALDETDRAEVVSYLNSKYALGGVAPQPPSITVSRGSNNTLIFAWPTTEAQFVLQGNDTLASDGWSDVTEAVVPSGDQNTVTVAITGPARFFRLVSNPNQP